MAVSTGTSYFTNALVGQMQVGSDIDINARHATPKFAVGTGFERADGCKFRYSHFGAAVNRGVLVSTDLSESNKGHTPNAGETVANLTKRANEHLKPNAAGSRYVQLTFTATAHQFDGGYLVIEDDAGEGFTYRIKGHDVGNGPVSGSMYMDLYDPLHTAIDSTTDISIAGCLYANLEIANGTQPASRIDSLVVGASCCNTSAQDFAWVQTKGTCGVLQDANVAVPCQIVMLSTNTNGAVTPLGVTLTGSAGTVITVPIGYCIVAGSSTAHTIVNLTIE